MFCKSSQQNKYIKNMQEQCLRKVMECRNHYLHINTSQVVKKYLANKLHCHVGLPSVIGKYKNGLLKSSYHIGSSCSSWALQ